MNYKTVNETEGFIYNDCVINEVHFNNNVISFVVEALVVKSSNSQNTNYTDSYAADTNITFIHSAVEKVLLLGYKKYDADDRLIEEVADKEINGPIQELKGLFEGSFLTGITKVNDQVYRVTIEIANEDPYAPTDDYELEIICDEVLIEWDKYLNRVQQY